MIKPEFWDDEKLASVSRDARLTFAGLWTYSDDYGVVKGNHVWLKNKIFPYDDDLRQVVFTTWIMSLEEKRFIIPFEVVGEKYYYITNFNEHQRVDHPSKLRNPAPPTDILASVSRVSRDETKTESETETKTKTETLVRRKAPDERDIRLVQLLIDLMQKNNPDSAIIKRLMKAGQRKWIAACRLLRETDKRTPEEIEAVIRFSQADEFWRSNILSMPKLREKWDQLWMKMNKSQFKVQDQMAGIKEWLKDKEKENEK